MADYEISNARVRAALLSAKRGAATQILLERALGQGLLRKMQGAPANLVEIYRGLGGADDGVIAMLESDLGTEFEKLPVGPGVEAAQRAAASNEVIAALKGEKGGGASGGKSVTALTALAREEDQAIHTLAALGGDAFEREIERG